MSPRVAFFLPSLRGGGAERVVVALASHLASRGIPVDLVVASAVGPFVDELGPDVRLLDLHSDRVLRALPDLVRYLLRVRPAALLATPSHAGAIAVLAQKIARTPTNVIVREASTASLANRHAGAVARFRNRLVARFTYNLASAVIAVSEGVAEDLSTFARIRHGRVHVIPNPVDLPHIQARAAEYVEHPWFAEARAPILLAAGRLTRDKDFGTLLRAFKLARSSRDLRLVILGDGELYDELHTLARELDVAEHVLMPGFQANPFAYMVRASLFVLSSVREGMPNVLLQALACGCPIVSTDCRSGPSEILAGGAFGRMVPVRDPVAMAGAILRTLEEPVDRQRLRDRAAAFDIEEIAGAYLDAMVNLSRESYRTLSEPGCNSAGAIRPRGIGTPTLANAAGGGMSHDDEGLAD